MCTAFSNMFWELPVTSISSTQLSLQSFLAIHTLRKKLSSGVIQSPLPQASSRHPSMDQMNRMWLVLALYLHLVLPLKVPMLLFHRVPCFGCYHHSAKLLFLFPLLQCLHVHDASILRLEGLPLLRLPSILRTCWFTTLHITIKCSFLCHLFVTI